MKRFLWAAWESGPQIVQLALASNAILLAFILLDPNPTFPNSLGYRWMAAHGTEAQWGAGFLAVGIVGLCGIVSRSLHIRAFAALISSIMTGVIGLSFYTSNPAGTGWGTYSILTGLSYWLLWHRIYRHA